MIPDEHRFSVHRHRHGLGCYHEIDVIDWDQRRVIKLNVESEEEDIIVDDEVNKALFRDTGVVRQHIDDVGLNVMAMNVAESGKVTMSTDPQDDDYRLPEHMQTVLRSDLVELDRIAGEVDLISYATDPGMKKFVFKYSMGAWSIDRIWAQIHILGRISCHPNIVPLDRLVLEEISKSGVVGFTTPFIPGGDLSTNPRPFKLKWLTQLMEVVDTLNSYYGVVHQNITPQNLFINPETDCIMLSNFDNAAKIGIKGGGEWKGGEGELAGRDDVKGVIFTLYAIITRKGWLLKDGALQDFDKAMIVDSPEMWVKHPDVRLDPGLDANDYYKKMMRWVETRRTACPMKNYLQASKPINWPLLIPEPAARYIEAPSLKWPRRLRLFKVEGLKILRCDRRRFGLPCLEWQRPAKTGLQLDRRLLATGKYADDNSTWLPEELDGQTGRLFTEIDRQVSRIFAEMDRQVGRLSAQIDQLGGRLAVLEDRELERQSAHRDDISAEAASPLVMTKRKNLEMPTQASAKRTKTGLHNGP
ncbi:hypothetical protein QBC46DRAFT_407333 [Diplogelasinospora grovesii]|uniref:Protein kinase domain-containing protein n=1 Tax=Diplogelasinospora grovesii TaxID=303347 RepID=A0AAN6N957_9PEZI|nr:hypothetical protein QBC46DRAFT_407333 [Diplogelasinospora grovesii]